jgi:hypothetical protein
MGYGKLTIGEHLMRIDKVPDSHLDSLLDNYVRYWY